MLKLLIISLILTSCATAPNAIKFDGKWEFINGKACLSKSDIIKLRELLTRQGK